jgi:ribonuclease BN (tRNA processing enzyme)
VKIQLLPSSFDSAGKASPEQRLTCFLIDEFVAIDAGSIALALAPEQREGIRDIVITHPHMDHIASLPIFIDDLFATLREPIRIHATDEVIAALERDVFNWTVYPRFSELENEYGPVMVYRPFNVNQEFAIGALRFTAIPVNHLVPTVGLIVKGGSATVAFSSDTAQTDEFWHALNRLDRLDALFIEASFPSTMAKLAEVSYHLTPATLRTELGKLTHNGFDILAVHLKPSYREALVKEIDNLEVPGLSIMVPGQVYEW